MSDNRSSRQPAEFQGVIAGNPAVMIAPIIASVHLVSSPIRVMDSVTSLE